MKKLLVLLVPLVFAVIAVRAHPARSDTGDLNHFTLSLTQAVIAHHDDAADNVVVSPYNALEALSLAAGGAGGATREEFAKALYRTEGAKLDEAVKDFSELNKTVLAANKGHVELSAASGLWINKNVAAAKPAYAAAAKENFDATLADRDFADAKTVDEINAWAKDQTHGLIGGVLQRLDPQDALVLASALYFKGSWTYKFDKAKTESGKFTADGGKAFKTPMMSQSFMGDGQITEQDRGDYQAVALTYGTQDASTMRLVLLRPKDPKLAARDWLAQQSGYAPPDWLDGSKFSSVHGEVWLPHLDIRQHHGLIPALQDLGVKTAFSGGADFTGMADVKGGKTAISQVAHDIVFKTDEEGSEAAAVTTTVMTLGIETDGPRWINIAFNRSFVFALQDIRTHAVLFLGVVNKPNNEMTAQ
jgi:serpin B